MQKEFPGAKKKKRNLTCIVQHCSIYRVVCGCGQDAVLRTVKKDSINKGEYRYVRDSVWIIDAGGV